MADFTRDTAADMAAGNPGINMGTSGSMKDMEWGSDRESVEAADARKRRAKPAGEAATSPGTETDDARPDADGRDRR